MNETTKKMLAELDAAIDGMSMDSKRTLTGRIPRRP